MIEDMLVSWRANSGQDMEAGIQHSEFYSQHRKNGRWTHFGKQGG